MVNEGKEPRHEGRKNREGTPEPKTWELCPICCVAARKGRRSEATQRSDTDTYLEDLDNLDFTDKRLLTEVEYLNAECCEYLGSGWLRGRNLTHLGEGVMPLDGLSRTRQKRCSVLTSWWKRRLQTGEDWIASKMAFKSGLTSATGGDTPHIRTSSEFARVTSSLLSFTSVKRKSSGYTIVLV